MVGHDALNVGGLGSSPNFGTNLKKLKSFLFRGYRIKGL